MILLFYLFELKTGQQHPALVSIKCLQDRRWQTDHRGKGTKPCGAFTAQTHAVIAGTGILHDETAAVLVKDFLYFTIATT